MIRIAGVLLITLSVILGCNSQTGNKTSDSKPSSGKTVDDALADIKAQTSHTGTENNQVTDKPVHLTRQDFLDKVMDYEKNPDEWVYKGNLPCLIDFYADWCAPCRITAPILDELAKEYAGKITIYKIDVQKEQELAAVFGVQGIPAFLYCPMDGQPSITSGIAQTREDTKGMFIQYIENLLLKQNPPSKL